jgi:hypothetical protein
MKSTPLELVKERFGGKEKLVAEVQKLATGDLWVDRVNSEKGLGRASNAKLLRLHATLTALRDRFGTRDKLIAEILKLEKRDKDGGLKTRLEGYPAPRLLDILAAAERRRKRADAKAKRPSAVAKKRAARSRKAKAKASAS